MQAKLPDVSRITDRIFLSSLPRHEHAEYILGLGVRLIVSLPLYWPPRVFRRPPFRFVHCPCIDSPLAPIPILILRRGVCASFEALHLNENVLIHCRGGVHRSVAMTCCILIAHGYSADDAMKFVIERRPAADPYAPYIQSRIRKFEQDWHERPGYPPDFVGKV